MIPYLIPPIQKITSPELERAQVSLTVVREDMNHPTVSGNKWWKLRYNLEQARAGNYAALLTFGGAYSNHIHATAAAAKLIGCRSIGIIRGEETLPLNPTLSFAKAQGMELHYVDRMTYRKRSDLIWIEQLKHTYGHCYVIPEGGTNEWAIKGCAEWAADYLSKMEPDFVCLPVGTGGTMAGILNGMTNKSKVLGFSVLKNGSFLQDDVQKWLTRGIGTRSWEILTMYDHGGYAKTNDQLDSFIREFEIKHSTPLEFVYSGKMMWGIFDLVSKGYFPKGSKIIALHTGGLQACKTVKD